MNQIGDIDWCTIGQLAKQTFNETHDKNSDLSVKERLHRIKNWFDAIISEILNNPLEFQKACEYVASRNSSKKKLTKIENGVLDEIMQIFFNDINIQKCVEAHSASSFSAGTYLSGESDLDFNVLVENLDENDLSQVKTALIKRGYQYVESRGAVTDPNIHHVFQKFIQIEKGKKGEKVEIEFKLRNMAPYMKTIHGVHRYLEKTMTDPVRTIVTWAKFNLNKIGKEDYGAFKAMCYEWANANAHSNRKDQELMYPLK